MTSVRFSYWREHPRQGSITHRKIPDPRSQSTTPSFCPLTNDARATVHSWFPTVPGRLSKNWGSSVATDWCNYQKHGPFYSRPEQLRSSAIKNQTKQKKGFRFRWYDGDGELVVSWLTARKEHLIIKWGVSLDIKRHTFWDARVLCLFISILDRSNSTALVFLIMHRKCRTLLTCWVSHISPLNEPIKM